MRVSFQIVLSSDKELTQNLCHNHQSLSLLVILYPTLSWLKIWDIALDCGLRGTNSALCLFSTLCRPLFGDRACPVVVTQSKINIDQTYLQHHPELHWDSVDKILEYIENGDPDIFDIGQRLAKDMQ